MRPARIAALVLLGALSMTACDTSPTRPDMGPDEATLLEIASTVAQPDAFVYQDIRHPDAAHTFVNRVNNRGDVVGDFCDAGWTCRGFRARRGVYETIDFPGSTFTYAYGTNDRADIVGVYGAADGEHAYSYMRGEYQELPAPEGLQTRAYAISETGLISGSYRGSSGKWQPVVWLHGEFTPLTDLTAELGADMAEGFGVNVQGAVVGHFTRPGDLDPTTGRQKMYGFVYGDRGLEATLDYPGSGWMSCAWGIGGSGEVLGHYVDPVSGGVTGYRWQGGSFTARLRVPGAVQTYPQAMTATGTIAGWAFKPTIGVVGFLASSK